LATDLNSDNPWENITATVSTLLPKIKSAIEEILEEKEEKEKEETNS
jgi:hypothetical protein